MAAKRNNKALPVSELFKQHLPQDFSRKRAQIEQFQAFFATRDSDAVFQMVTVNNVTASELSLTLPSAALASYLRLHAEQLRQQIREMFGVELSIKISTRPDVQSAAHDGNRKKRLAADISSASCDQMTSSAEFVDDERLRNALKSLSKTLAKEPGQR